MSKEMESFRQVNGMVINVIPSGLFSGLFAALSPTYRVGHIEEEAKRTGSHDEFIAYLAEKTKYEILVQRVMKQGVNIEVGNELYIGEGKRREVKKKAFRTHGEGNVVIIDIWLT